MLETLSIPSGLCCHVSASFPPLRPLSKPATAETPEQTMPRLPASPLLVSFQFSPCFIHPGTSILAEPVHKQYPALTVCATNFYAIFGTPPTPHQEVSDDVEEVRLMSS